jgi:predicted RecA/RadA family phage recombinase
VTIAEVTGKIVSALISEGESEEDHGGIFIIPAASAAGAWSAGAVWVEKDGHVTLEQGGKTLELECYEMVDDECCSCYVDLRGSI